MQFKYNYEKNAKLLIERKIGFDEIIQAIVDDNILDIKDHPNPIKYLNQKIFYIQICGEVYAVPFIEEIEGNIFFKTIFPSRKARKQFLENT